jgi:shikimate kinase
VRHVLLYGPPAAGKLTVARMLAERYNMTLLDNHMTFDVALRVFDFGTQEFNELVESLRTVLLEATAAAGRDSVSTFVFGHEVDRPYVARVEATATRCGIDLCRVQLCPPPEVLQLRVTSESRLSTNKIRDPETLVDLLAKYDLYAPIDTADLKIDNSERSPEEVVAEIAAYLAL